MVASQTQCPSGKAMLCFTASIRLMVHMFWHNAGNIVKLTPVPTIAKQPRVETLWEDGLAVPPGAEQVCADLG